MRRRSAFLFQLLACASLTAQTVENAGVSPEWDVRSQMAKMAADVRKLDPLLKNVKPGDWVSAGAPEVFIGQLDSVQRSLSDLIASTSGLAQKPENLPLALDTYFKIDRIRLLLNSLAEGVRKYQHPDLANLITQEYPKLSEDQDRLREHIRDLARTREREFQVVDEEAQRCRSSLMRQLEPGKRSGRNRSQSQDQK